MKLDLDSTSPILGWCPFFTIIIWTDAKIKLEPGLTLHRLVFGRDVI